MLDHIKQVIAKYRGCIHLLIDAGTSRSLGVHILCARVATPDGLHLLPLYVSRTEPGMAFTAQKLLVGLEWIAKQVSLSLKTDVGNIMCDNDSKNILAIDVLEFQKLEYKTYALSTENINFVFRDDVPLISADSYALLSEGSAIAVVQNSKLQKGCLAHIIKNTMTTVIKNEPSIADAVTATKLWEYVFKNHSTRARRYADMKAGYSSVTPERTRKVEALRSNETTFEDKARIIFAETKVKPQNEEELEHAIVSFCAMAEGYGKAQQAADAVPKCYSVGQCGRVLGACIHLGVDSKDCASAGVLEEIRRRAALVSAHSSTDVQRVTLAQRYILPLVTYFPSPCLNDKTTQHHISRLVRRGLPGLGGVRGIRQAFFLPLRLGGRGVISLSDVIQCRTLDVVRQASLHHHHGQRLVSRAAAATRRPSEIDTFWGTFRASVKSLQLSVSSTTTLHCCVQSLPNLTREPVVAADASLIGAKACVGLAWGNPPHQTFTLRLSGDFTSSYEAEMAACVIAGMSGSRLVLNDNQAVVNTLSVAYSTPPLGACPGLTNAALSWGAQFKWTKGHSGDANSEASLNSAADSASRASRQSLEYYPYFRLLDAAGCVVGHAKKIIESRHRAQWLERLSLSASTSCVDTGSSTFTFYTSLPPYVADTVLTLRTRALFPVSATKHQLVCVCGAPLLHDLHHIALFCAHPTHTANLASLVRSLSPLGRGWWDVRDHTVPCPSPHSGYSCQHQFLCLPPQTSDQKTKRALEIWAKHMHARLAVCHPGNWTRRQHLSNSAADSDDDE
eukprot:PhM_4_TR438/c1_g2_i1/m.20074